MLIYKAFLSMTAVLLFTGVANTNFVHAQNSQSVEPRTEAAVIAADKGWGQAEESGDTAYIDALLLPEYRSVNVDGSTHDKAAILAGARKNRALPERVAAIEKWKAAHPLFMAVQITGDLAIVTFALDKKEDKSDEPDKPAAQKQVQKPIMSCDVFVYQNGHWRALYSQHTAAGS